MADLRAGLLVAGIVLLLIGVVLVEYPLEPQTIPVNNTGASSIEAVQVNSPLMSQHFEVSWSASSSGTMQYGVCAQIPNAPTALGNCSQTGSGSGTSGTFSFSASNGQFVVLFFSGSSGTASAKTTIPTAGVLVIVIGVILLLAGAALRSQPKVQAAQPGPTPPVPPDQTATPPTSK